MALFCQNRIEIAAELTRHKPAYADMCIKFAQHFLWIATALIHAGGDVGVWDEEDGFFSDVLRLPFGDLLGQAVRLQDRLSPAVYDRRGDYLLIPGLYLDMPPWGYHVFEVTRGA